MERSERKNVANHRAVFEDGDRAFAGNDFGYAIGVELSQASHLRSARCRLIPGRAQRQHVERLNHRVGGDAAQDRAGLLGSVLSRRAGSPDPARAKRVLCESSETRESGQLRAAP